MEPLKSWYASQYPPHACPTCGLEHVRIPNVVLEQTVQGKKSEVHFVPFELLGVIDGPVKPGQTTPYDTPAHVYGLVWGLPGAGQAHYDSVIYMN